MRLTDIHRPFIVCVITNQSVDAAIATMEMARYEGANAYELNLPPLAAAGPAALRSIFASHDWSVYTSCRRTAFMGVYGLSVNDFPAWSDEERMRRQLEALDLGSIAIDIEMDTYDPHPAPALGTAEAAVFARSEGSPAEISLDADAVRRQRSVVDAAHGAGGEVIFSCHTGRPQTCGSLIEVAERAVDRGADLLKIVTPCVELPSLFALLDATVRLKESLPIPFTLVGAGDVGDLSRTIGVLFGSGWAFGQQSFTPGGFHPQPLVAHLREVWRLLPWRYPSPSKES